MKTRLGAFQLSQILTELIALFALLMMWPNNAPYFKEGDNESIQSNDGTLLLKLNNPDVFTQM